MELIEALAQLVGRLVGNTAAVLFTLFVCVGLPLTLGAKLIEWLAKLLKVTENRLGNAVGAVWIVGFWPVFLLWLYLTRDGR